MKNSLIIIPIRMHSSRLPGKFHADIEGKPMVIRVLEQAITADIGNVYVAGDNEIHQKIIEDAGSKFIMTGNHHQSGSDRIFEALTIIEQQENKKYDYIVNLQGDCPFINPKNIAVTTSLLNDNNIDIGTIAAKIIDQEEINNPNVVKIAFTGNKAHYFSRSPIPYNAKNYYHHIGVYAYKRDALEKFISLPQSPLEKCERLEQLRAIENGMNIGIEIVNEIPITVDTEEDLTKARLYAKKFSSFL